MDGSDVDQMEKKAPAEIICVGGEFEGFSFSIYADEQIVIGRDPVTANIVLANPAVSRKHCVVRYFEPTNSFYVMDQSTQGTYKDSGERLGKNRSEVVMPGTVISICDGEERFLLTSNKS